MENLKLIIKCDQSINKLKYGIFFAFAFCVQCRFEYELLNN